MPTENPPQETPPRMSDLRGFLAEVLPITPNRPRTAPTGWRVLDATIAGKLTILPKVDSPSRFRRSRARGTVLAAAFRRRSEDKKHETRT